MSSAQAPDLTARGDNCVFSNELLEEIFSHIVDLPPIMDYTELPADFPLTMTKSRRPLDPCVAKIGLASKRLHQVVMRRVWSHVVLDKVSQLDGLPGVQYMEHFHQEDLAKHCKQLTIFFRTDGHDDKIHALLDRMRELKAIAVWLPSCAFFAHAGTRGGTSATLLQIGALPMKFNVDTLRNLASFTPNLRVLQVYDCPAVATEEEKEGSLASGRFFPNLQMLSVGFPSAFLPETRHSMNMFLEWITIVTPLRGMLRGLVELVVFNNVGGLVPFMNRYGDRVHTLGCESDALILRQEGSYTGALQQISKLRIHIAEQGPTVRLLTALPSVRVITVVRPNLPRGDPRVQENVLRLLQELNRVGWRSGGKIEVEVEEDLTDHQVRMVERALRRLEARDMEVFTFRFRKSISNVVEEQY